MYSPVFVLLLWQVGALGLQVLAVCMSRSNDDFVAHVVSTIAIALVFASALWFLVSPRLTRRLRNTAVLCLGITTALQWRMTNPLTLYGFDEQLHLRTLRDIVNSHGLYQPHPLLTVTPRYPGLEALTAFVHQLGIPLPAATMVTVILARIVLVVVLCDAAEQLTRSVRAGGLAVAIYAVSAQFVWFNSQFAYQTLALPLALAAVSLIARGRSASNPRPLLAGATVCILAMVVTHHVTSVITTIFLCLWVAFERHHRARLCVLYGALVAIAGTVIWAALQWSLLQGYFGPMIDDVTNQVTGGIHRTAFADGSGSMTPLWQQIFLVYYAGATSLAAAFLLTRHLRLLAAQGNLLAVRGTRALMVIITSLIPLLFVVRILPSGGEICDRSSGFVFIPFSILLAEAILNRAGKRARHRPPLPVWRSTTRRAIAALLATGVFVGGYLAGSGPDMARLPGPYAVGSNRSVDPETLAAVRWTAENLPAGSRFGADFVSSNLLANEAGMWPVRYNAPALYFAKDWGPDQTALAKEIHLPFLYVDRRMADGLPHVGWYFDKSETPAPERLTLGQLDKFGSVAGVREIYRHGPISIYDLTGLGIQYESTGWVGPSVQTDLSVQFAVGLLIGLLLIPLNRSGGSTLVRSARNFVRAAGAAHTFAVTVAALVLVSVVLLLVHAWFTPALYLSAAAVVAVANPQVFRAVPKYAARKRYWRIVAGGVLLAIPVAIIITQAWLNAAHSDVSRVDDILKDPRAVHVPIITSHSGRPPMAGEGPEMPSDGAKGTPS